MQLIKLNVLGNLWPALKQFWHEEGLDKCSILAYYSISSSIFLITFFTFLFTRFLGDPDLAMKTLYPLSPDFFTRISPDIFLKAAEISDKMKEVGVIGILFSFVLGFMVIQKIVLYTNSMFHLNVKVHKTGKRFLLRRFSEFSLVFLIGFLMVTSFFFTGIISAVTAAVHKNEFLASYINPGFVDAVNHFLLKYLVPFLITFVFFFTLYKWIPEKVVYIRAALFSAALSAILWEITKRGFTYYMANISVFSHIKGPIIAIILFGFWMEISMGILLFGAKLTYLMDREKNDAIEFRRNQPEAQRATEG